MTSVQNQGNQQFQTIPPIQAYSQTPMQPVPQVQQVTQGYNTVPQGQSASSPSYAGVNIQIYNPSVGIPNINPTGNMPQSQALPGQAYPSNYYTGQFVTPPQAGIIAQGGQGGNATVYNMPPASNGSAAMQPAMMPAGNSQSEDIAALASKNFDDVSSTSNTTTSTKETKETTGTEEKKKTEKRKIVELTDEYIKNLENYLNSQDKEVRMMGAKEVVARLQEDDSRKDDPALTALINKMLQDPDQNIRVLALSMLDSRTCTGNDYTVNVLKKMQNSTAGYGQDAAQATNILLKMSGKVVEKEFEVPENSTKK